MNNVAMEAFTPQACWPIALKLLEADTIPTDPIEGTKALAELLAKRRTKRVRNLAHDVMEELKGKSPDLDFDVCYDQLYDYFRKLQDGGPNI